MEEHFFVHFKGVNQAGEKRNQLLYFRESEIKEAEAFLRDWLTKGYGLTCMTADEAEGAKRNGGLPKGIFVCPDVKAPADLEKYNQSLAGIDFLVEAIYDIATARQFRDAAIQEYNLDAVLTPMTDEMNAILTGIKETFDPRYSASVDLDYVMRFVNELLRHGGMKKY